MVFPYGSNGEYNILGKKILKSVHSISKIQNSIYVRIIEKLFESDLSAKENFDDP